MCMSCGCGKPNDNHGDVRNITLSNLEQAAQNIANCAQQMKQQGSQAAKK